VLKENVGSQDQVSVAHGGFNRIEFKRDGTYDAPRGFAQGAVEAAGRQLDALFYCCFAIFIGRG